MIDSSHDDADRAATSASMSSTVDRIAAVLAALGSNDNCNELHASDIARMLGRERTQISRMLKKLSSTGLVEQNPGTRAYRLGWQICALASQAGDQRLLAAGRPVLRSLVIETKESALLSVLQSGRSFTVLRERSPHTLQAGGWVGRTSPLHVTASGRALILDRTDDEVGELTAEGLHSGSYGPKQLTSLPAIFRRLHDERAKGYTLAVEELEEGLVAIGAPVRDPLNQIVAAINISGPAGRMLHNLDSLSIATRAAASRLSGHRLYRRTDEYSARLA